MGNISRRTFFKRLGMITGCAAIAPSVSIVRLAYPDFVPGERLRNAVLLRAKRSMNFYDRPVKNFPEYSKGKRILNQWLKRKVPPGFRHGSIKHKFQIFDFGNGLGVMVDYRSPRRYRR